MWTRKELKNKAKEALKRNYWKAVLAAFFLAIVTGGIGSNYSSHSNYTQHNNKQAEAFYETHHWEDVIKDNGLETALNDAVDEIGQSNLFLIGAVIAIVIIVVALIILAVVILLDAFLVNPFIVGIRRFFVQDLEQKASISELAYGFDHNYKNIVKTMFLKNLFVFFWTLLFIIPGIIKAYEYRMIVYILGENPQMDSETAFALSKKMMNGEKWNTFVLDLSFLGWHILSLFTFGLLNIFYVLPYQYHANAALYDVFKRNHVNSISEETQI